MPPRSRGPVRVSPAKKAKILSAVKQAQRRVHRCHQLTAGAVKNGDNGENGVKPVFHKVLMPSQRVACSRQHHGLHCHSCFSFYGAFTTHTGAVVLSQCLVCGGMFARRATFVLSILSLAPGLSSPREIPQVDRTRPQTFRAKQLA